MGIIFSPTFVTLLSTLTIIDYANIACSKWLLSDNCKVRKKCKDYIIGIKFMEKCYMFLT